MSSGEASETATSTNAARYIRFRLTAIDTVPADTKSYPEPTALSPNVPFLYRRSPFFGSKVPIHKVPEIRIWGATDQGQRCCVHIHGALPYLYIDYTGPLDPEAVQAHIRKLGRSLNLAMFYSFRGRKGRTDFDPLRDQYIPYIVLCKGIPFYGFHVGYRYFLKIYCLQPKYMWRLTEILKSGAVLKTVNKGSSEDSTKSGPPVQAEYPVYEAHVPFLLQFMLDFNLYGCGWVELSGCMFRDVLPPDQPDPASSHHNSASGPTAKLYTESTIPEAMRFREGQPRRISPNSALEFDCHVSEILNRLAVEPRNLHQDFTELLEHPIPDDAKLVYSVKGVWDDERQRRKERGQKGPFEESEASASQRKYQQGETPEWAMSKHFRPILESMIEEDKKRYLATHKGQWPPDFRTFVTKPLWDEWIPTTFQSVESLFPSTMEKDERRGEENPFGVWAVQGIGVQLGHSRAPSEDPTGGIDASALQKLAWQVEQQRSNAAPPQGSPKSDDERDIEPAHYRDDDASEPEDDGEPLIDDEELDEAGLYPSVRRRSVSPTNADSEQPPPSPITDPLDLHNDLPMSPPREMEVSEPPDDSGPAPAENGHHSRDPLMETKVSVIDEHPAMSDIDFNTSDMFTSSSPAVALRQRRSHAYSMPPTTDTTAPKRPKNLFSLRRRSSSSKSPSEADRHAGSFVAAAEPKTQTRADLSGLGITSNSTGAVASRFDRAVTEPIYNLPSSWSATQDQHRPPVEGATAESPQIQNLSPTQLLTGTVDEDKKRSPSRETSSLQERPPPQKRARFEEPSVELDYRLSQHSTDSGKTKASSNPQSADSVRSERIFKFDIKPPTRAELYDSMLEYSRHDGMRHRPFLQIRYQDPFYSIPSEVPRRPQEFAGSLFRIGGKGPRWLTKFQHDSHLSQQVFTDQPDATLSEQARRWEYAIPPPPKRSCLEWLRQEIQGESRRGHHPRVFPSQIRGATQNNPYGFKFSQFKTSTSSNSREKEHMDVLALELQCASRGDKLPDPEEDEILAIFYCLYSDSDSTIETEGARKGCLVGCVAQNQWQTSNFDQHTLDRLGLGQYAFDIVDSELELINTFVDKVVAWDPEVLCGYEIQKASWGYLLERAQQEYDISLVQDLSRVIEQSTGRHAGKLDRWHYTKSATIKITGRHVLPIWRLLKSDVNLLQYSFENVVYHILHIRTPHFSQKTLFAWMSDGVVAHLSQTFKYWLTRVEMDIALIEDAEVITNKTEFARIYGVDFASVINRGSQFKVESVMFRIAKPESFVLLSPSREEVGRQNALEAIPLIAEPKSAFYKDPIVVLDFQSLYPSVMIGYNYCYSTCLGRVGKFKGTPKFGVTNLYLPDGLLYLLKDHITVSPNGFIFVKPVVRRSLLAKMLSELLSTRVMVKSSMKLIKNDKALTRVYNARQLGLKLLANVTYGYTSATFSGRMPCAEIADAIVQTGRESLERARKIIHENKEWGADVVYGDTDSLFIWLPGKTKQSAFDIGYDMAEKITSTNVAPVKLKFEKVYLPSVLASKKRYVGFKFESPDEQEPVLDAKGIETIRRDGFPAVQKMLEAAIRILFKTQDLSRVKAYCETQWAKFVMGSLSPQDFIFAKEVKLGTYSENGIPPPGAVIARNRQLKDHRDEVQYGERVPYIVPEAYGGQTRLVDRALEPHQFLESRSHRIDAGYYIKFTIAALNRVFTLLGVDTANWVAKMPKIYRVAESHGTAPSTLSQLPTAPSRSEKVTIDRFYRSDRCLSCDITLEDKTQELCSECLLNPALASYQLMQQASSGASRRMDLQRICAACAEQPATEATECDSIACPIYYARKMADRAYSTSASRVVERTWSMADLKALSASV